MKGVSGMGDVVQASYLTPDIVVIVIRGPLGGDAQKILAGAIDQAMANPARWRKIFIADLSQASGLEESDAKVLEETQMQIRLSGGTFGVVDPQHHLPYQARDLEFFASIDDAIRTYEDMEPVDVQIYLSDESASQEVQFAVEALLDHFGVVDLQGERPELGSWYRKFRGWTSRANVDRAEVNLARALNIQMVERHQADIDAVSAQIVTMLVAALEKTPGAVIQAGSTIFVKSDGIVMSRQLPPDEMLFWQDNPSLFKDPRRALRVLQRTEPVEYPFNLGRFHRDSY